MLFYAKFLLAERKRMRESTTQKSLEVRQRTMESLKNQDANRRKPSEHRVMTQEQLLEEAKITELKNLKSLGMIFCIVKTCLVYTF